MINKKLDEEIINDLKSRFLRWYKWFPNEELDESFSIEQWRSMCKDREFCIIADEYFNNWFSRIWLNV